MNRSEGVLVQLHWIAGSKMSRGSLVCTYLVLVLPRDALEAWFQ